MALFSRKSAELVDPRVALTGRANPIVELGEHAVLGTRCAPPFPAGLERAIFAMGCFWGAERRFWQVPGVYATAVGYCGGVTPNPTYEEVCSGRTNHAEAVLVVFDPARTSYGELVRVFFEGHDPTQRMRQGNDIGTQYRTAVFTTSDEQARAAAALRSGYAALLAARGYGPIATEIVDAKDFYAAEEYHQQYLAKNPGGYCGLGGTGVACPVGVLEGGGTSTPS